MPDNTQRKISLFNKRWNVTFDDTSTFQHLKNRLLFILDEVLGKYVLSNTSFQNRYAYLIGYQAPVPLSGDLNLIYKNVEAKNIGFQSTQIYQEFFKAQNQITIVWLLQYLFLVLEEGKYYDSQDLRLKKRDELAEKVKEVLKLTPNIHIRLYKNRNGVHILPIGAKPLDEALVNDVLVWLDDYPEIKKHYYEALQMVMEKNPLVIRNLLDNLRLSLEMLLKIVLKNNEPLEEQSKYLKRWLNLRGIEENIRLMFTDLLSRDRYTQLMNEAVKHGDRVWQPAEIEFLVYQTGMFIRFLIEATQIPEREVISEFEGPN